MDAAERSMAWRRSSHSGSTNNCVEVADGLPGVMPVRDSKDVGGPTLAFSAGAWRAFLAGVRAGVFDGRDR
ncbi:DUF397 domain-containing protein [Kitasatospora sp. LaBMicrA B282]|uniref:DUF397 domain-containing protein n=1 Tax=Kitasatospora sp. LaBMicrA B282 TaxID=3420949 RepID=UPI003D0A35DF